MKGTGSRRRGKGRSAVGAVRQLRLPLSVELVLSDLGAGPRRLGRYRGRGGILKEAGGPVLPDPAGKETEGSTVSSVSLFYMGLKKFIDFVD